MNSRGKRSRETADRDKIRRAAEGLEALQKEIAESNKGKKPVSWNDFKIGSPGLKLSIKIGVTADPEPDPHIVFVPPRHRVKIARNANRPEARIFSKSLQMEAGMGRILLELL